jgi:hypothetical protein
VGCADQFGSRHIWTSFEAKRRKTIELRARTQEESPVILVTRAAAIFVRRISDIDRRRGAASCRSAYQHCGSLLRVALRGSGGGARSGVVSMLQKLGGFGGKLVAMFL